MNKNKGGFKLSRFVGFGHVIGSEKIEDQQLKVFFVRNTIENARLGIVVRKSSFKTAVKRNKIKRVIRETFSKHTIRSQKLDLVVLPKAVDSIANKANLTVNLQGLFSKIETKCAAL